MGIWDRTGTASVANGSDAVTGSLTAWNSSAKPGDGISFDGGGKFYEILTVNSNTSLTLASNFAETTVSAGAFIIWPGYRHVVPTDILEQLRLVLASQTDLFETSGAPSPSLGADKSLAIDPVARVYYYKTDGLWGDPVFLGGADGVDAGFKALFNTATGMADPGAGKIRFNNATRASVTAIAIDDSSADAGNPDVSPYILTWDASTSTVRGTLILRKVGAALNFAVFAVTGASVDNSGWTQITVTHIASGGTFTDDDPLSVVFVRSGDKGTAGADGVSAGPLYTLSTNTSMADPGTGTVRFNNSTIASATQLAIDITSANAGNPNFYEFIKMWDDSTNPVRGVLTFTKRGAEANFAQFTINGALTDNTGWLQVPLTYVTGGGTLANGDVLVVQFDRTGNKGADGLNGLSPGFQYSFSTTITMADPSSGALRLNSATLSAASEIAISKLSGESGNPSIEATIASWDDSTNAANRGLLKIRKLSAPQNFASYAIAADNNASLAWVKLTVAYVDGFGSFSNGDIVTIEFARTGDKGLDGSGAVLSVNGQTGAVVLGLGDLAAGNAILHSLFGGI